MGSRQRPSGHKTSDTGSGGQARAGKSAASERAAGADQQRHEEEMLSDAREDVDETLPGEDSGAAAPNER